MSWKDGLTIIKSFLIWNNKSLKEWLMLPSSKLLLPLRQSQPVSLALGMLSGRSPLLVKSWIKIFRRTKKKQQDRFLFLIFTTRLKTNRQHEEKLPIHLATWAKATVNLHSSRNLREKLRLSQWVRVPQWFRRKRLSQFKISRRQHMKTMTLKKTTL
jgi:hypothetical protein